MIYGILGFIDTLKENLLTMLTLRKDIRSFAKLKKQIKKLKNAPDSLYDLLVKWITYCDGYLFDTYVLDHPDHTIVFLNNKTIQLLEKLDVNTSDSEILSLLAHEFEGLYFHSSINNQKWDSTKESYKDFVARFNQSETKLPDNFHLDQPSIDSEIVLNWLRQELAK